MKYSPFVLSCNIWPQQLTVHQNPIFDLFCRFGTFLLFSFYQSFVISFFVAPQLHLCLFCINCSSLSSPPLNPRSVPRCQLCVEPGADKQWSASLQMAVGASAAWGGCACVWCWCGEWLQCKWAHTKENQLSAACYGLAAWSGVQNTHTHWQHLLCMASAMVLFLWTRLWKWRACLPIWHTPSVVAWRKEPQWSLHVRKWQWSECEQCHLFR